MTTPRQTGRIADFDDKLAFISLRRLDLALIVSIALFIAAAAWMAWQQTTTPSVYLVLIVVHNHLGRFALFLSTVMFVLALYIGLARHADVTPYFRRGVYIMVALIVLEALFGAVMYFGMNARPADEVHLIYGAGTILALPFFIFVERTATRRPAMGSYMWGFGLLAGIIIRCIMTGSMG
jgi:hypothetical protein